MVVVTPIGIPKLELWDEKKQLHPIWFKLLDSRPATIDEFRELEKKMNVKLPFEYEHIVTIYK